MKKDILPFWNNKLQELVTKHKTPFHLYDEAWIRDNLESLKSGFSQVPWFKEYYAVKACPNPYILEILKAEWCWMDCSSPWELILSEKVWIVWENIMFTSNNTSISEFQKAAELWAIINFSFYETVIPGLLRFYCIFSSSPSFWATTPSTGISGPVCLDCKYFILHLSTLYTSLLTTNNIIKTGTPRSESS